MRLSPDLLLPPHHYHHSSSPKFHPYTTSTTCRPRPGRRRFRATNSSFGKGWKLNHFNPDTVQERLGEWFLKTRNLINEVAAPLVNDGQISKDEAENIASVMEEGIGDLLMVDRTFDSAALGGNLSLSAVVSIEQFSKLNGLNGKKMQKILETLGAGTVQCNARNLVEYCCFRYLSRNTSDVHPSLKEVFFQQLIFVTMLAWENPYSMDNDVNDNSFQSELVSEEAFIRIAPAVAGVADRPTAHNLYRLLIGREKGMSMSLWLMYLTSLLKIHEGRKTQIQKRLHFSGEQILCFGSSRRPVLKWEKNIGWPGNLTLTDKALYFEPISLTRKKETIRLDLTAPGSHVKKTKVGPMGHAFFDSALAVTSGLRSDTCVLEFVNFGREMRRDVWHSFISEVICVYEFINEYAPEDRDPSLYRLHGAHNGKRRALASASNSIARLQTLQYMEKITEDPSKLVQFTYLRNAPYGHVVCQTLAVNLWGGPLVKKQELDGITSNSMPGPSSMHVVDVDGSIYYRRWMKSSSWSSNESVTFWKNHFVRQGVVLGKNFVVGGKSLVERAALTCKERSQVVESTQATIDAAMIEGIPSNIDLFKELLFPCAIMFTNFEKLRRWEEPHLTASFLVFAYTIIFRNLLPYVLPMTLMGTAIAMLLFKGLKEQGRLGQFFGGVTIRDQPPSNTLQKIVALKEAMADMENYLQNVNISLLKVRTILLAGQPQITGEVAIVLFCAASSLLLVPFKYILAFFLLDLFTRELEFRRETVQKFMAFLKDRWATVPAAPLVVLPFDDNTEVTESSGKQIAPPIAKQKEKELKP